MKYTITLSDAERTAVLYALIQATDWVDVDDDPAIDPNDPEWPYDASALKSAMEKLHLTQPD